MKKSNKGFTLVELIVVIAIIGILAAILVPAMIGYIRDSKLSSANSSAKTVYNAGMAFTQKLVNAGVTLKEGKYDLGKLADAGSANAPTVNGYTTDNTAAYYNKPVKALNLAVCSSLNKDAANSVAVIWIGKQGFPIEVAWAKSDSDIYVGSYPKATEEETTGGIASYTAQDTAASNTAITDTAAPTT